MSASDDVKLQDGLEIVGNEGCVREKTGNRGAYELMSPFVAQADAHLFGWGAKNRGHRNWEKGCPFSRCIQSLERHIAKFKMRETDKDHDDNLSAIRFWAGALIHYKEMIKRGLLSPDLDDMPRYVPARSIAEEAATFGFPKLLESSKSMGQRHQFAEPPPLKPLTERPRLKIYVAGPITGKNDAERIMNCELGKSVGRFIESKGHLVFTPHNYESNSTVLEYEQLLDLDFSIIRNWSDAIYIIHSSPGTDRELELANKLGLRVFRKLDEIWKYEKEKT